MRLVIESGGTKADWFCLQPAGADRCFASAGLHPLFLSDEDILKICREVAAQMDTPPSEVFFYGTGCRPASVKQRLKRLLREVFAAATLVEVETDLLAAARGLCGRHAGTACILGTGSNACFYDGTSILYTAGGLGYVLGDEGSGADLGRALLNAFLNGLLPPPLAERFQQQYQTDRDAIIQAVYQAPAPNRYLASFAPFLAATSEEDFIHRLVAGQFQLFFERYLLSSPAAYLSLPLHFTGSIAFHFQHVLREVSASYGRSIAQAPASPSKGLLAYHHV